MDTFFLFYNNDHISPYLHVEKNRKTAKSDLGNAELIKPKCFNAKEIAEIRKPVIENIELFKSKWDEYIHIK